MAGGSLLFLKEQIKDIIITPTPPKRQPRLLASRRAVSRTSPPHAANSVKTRRSRSMRVRGGRARGLFAGPPWPAASSSAMLLVSTWM